MLKHLNFKIGLFFLVLAFLFGLFMVPTVGEDWQKTAGADVEFFTVGPRFFPYLSAGIMALLSLLLMIDSALKARSGDRGSRGTCGLGWLQEFWLPGPGNCRRNRLSGCGGRGFH